MKVIAQRKYYEKDLYRVRQTLFPLDEMPTKKDMALVHHKGDFADYDFRIKKCCTRGTAHIIFEGRWSDDADRTVAGAFLYLRGDDDELIDYCPFCGEEIEIYEKE